MRADGQPAAGYTLHVALGGVLVVMDLDRNGWRSITNDAAGVIADFAVLRPDLLARVPLVVYWGSIGQWGALCLGRKEAFAGFTPTSMAKRAQTGTVAGQVTVAVRGG